MQPFSLLIKPAGPDCNLACTYCFYAGKAEIVGPGPRRMSPEMLEHLVKSYLRLNLQYSLFTWQGGEPMLLGVDFYRRAVELQRQYGQPGQMVENALQTNGVLLDEAWSRFLAEAKFLCGISLDGPRVLHDHYRKDRQGGGSFARVMAGIECCRAAGVEFNILV